MSSSASSTQNLVWAALEGELRYLLERDPFQARSKLASLLRGSRHDPHWRARGMLWSARLHYAAGRYLRAEHLLVRLLEQHDDTELSNEVREDLGYALQSQGRLAAALEQFQRLLELSSTSGREVRRAVALEGLAVVYHYLDDRASSLDYQLQALELRRALYQINPADLESSDKLAMCLSNLSADYEKLGDFELAVRFAHSALELAGKSHNVRVELVALNNLGEALLHTQPSEALGVFQSLLERAEQLPSLKRVVWAHTGLGKGHLALCQLERTLEHFQQALELSVQHSLLLEQLETRLSMVTLQTPHDALNNLLEGLAQSRTELGGPFEALEAQLERQLSKTLEGLGHFERALEHLKRFVALEAGREQRRSQQQAEILAVRFATETYRRDALEWREQSQNLAQEMRHDPLTRLPNRRWLDEILEAAYQSALERNTKLCVAVLDIDFFKQVNDQFTHTLGDAVLRELSKVLERTLPGGATVARYGGEEFVMVLPGRELLEALGQVQRLLEEVEQHDWATLNPGLTLTLSAGLAELNLDAPDGAKALLARADAQLFEAKRRGRNQVSWEGG